MGGGGRGLGPDTETRELLDSGADEVVPEGFETSVEIFSRVLRHVLVGESRGVALRAGLRAGAYGFFRDPEAVAEPGGMRFRFPRPGSAPSPWSRGRRSPDERAPEGDVRPEENRLRGGGGQKKRQSAQSRWWAAFSRRVSQS